MKNKKILTVVILVILFNIFLIAGGIYLQKENNEKIKEEFFDDFTSRLFISNVSNGETNDYKEFEEMLDSEYIDSEGNSVKGFGTDDEGYYVEDSAHEFRRYASESMLSDYLSWNDIISVGSNMSFDPTTLESPELAATILVADKGASDGESWGIIIDNPIYASLAPTILLHGLEGLGIDLLGFNEQFTYVESIDGSDVEVIYDFSTSIEKDEINGVEGELLGVLNWDSTEVHEFFSYISISTDIRNNGDLHETITAPTGFRSDSNSYYLFSRLLKKVEQEYEGIKYNVLKPAATTAGLSNIIDEAIDHYLDGTLDEWMDSIEIGTSDIIDALVSMDKTPEWSLSIKKQNTIDSEGEALLYVIWSEFDYQEYFDRALEVDGMKSYDIAYIGELYGNGKFLTENYKPSKFDITGTGTIYRYGSDEEISFSEFVLLSQTYRPFLRSVNYEPLIWDLAELATDGVKEINLPN